jgi:hypothetical protein
VVRLPSNDNCTELFGVQEVESAASTINSNGQTIFVADAHRDDGKRFIVHADEKLTAFVELEAACACGELA